MQNNFPQKNHDLIKMPDTRLLKLHFGTSIQTLVILEPKRSWTFGTSTITDHGCIFRQLVHTGGGRKNKDEFRKFRKDKLKKQVYPPYFEAFEVKER